ncbi:reprolysin-like metallopeptidase [Chryseobacterium koreense]|uniref:reprolysin-like metallopeptidase n=1 Tax=Chryseobacterium koreense TaxID=232216 RepID=UPI0026EED40C|nr:zinc-dependent metalloprotease family protein [Chryseobacterium koreense]
MKTKITLLSGLLMAISGFGQNYWTKSSSVPTKDLNVRMTKPNSFSIYDLDLNKIKAVLAQSPMRFSNTPGQLVTFPNAEGKFMQYLVHEAPVMAPELQAKYPEIRSYIGVQKDNPANSVRFSVTPEAGVSAMYFDGMKVSYLDSYTKDNSKYIFYERKDLPVNDRIFECNVEHLIDENTTEPPMSSAPLISDGKMRTYRLALAATGEYTIYHGGTVAKALAAMNVAMTRVNGVYEKILSVTMVMVPNTDLLIYTDPNTDPYTNNNGSTMLGQNISTCNSVIGSANYDIGHVFSTGGGGVAYLASICGSSKAGGVTGLTAPINDVFYIDYVAHEMGHQFGANHTFNATTGSCGGGNRNLATAFEVGGGTTIMAYAGICTATNNVQNNSDAYFHSASVNEINNVITRASDCSVKTPNNNGVPTADAGANYTIPKGTAFVLTGAGTDPDGDPITYLWEQLDNQSSTQPPVSTATGGPNYRSFFATSSPSRYFPNMTSIMNNDLVPKWEVTPSVARTLNFSLLVSDNKATGNQSARSTMKVTVTNDGPFKVTSQTTNTQVDAAAPYTVTWDVAGTNAGTINTTTVTIYLTKDGGATFNPVATSVPNTGTATFMLPNEDVNSARLMVKADNNIYFAVNSSNFSIKKFLAVGDVNVKNIAIYPNPAANEVNVMLKNKSESASYSIYDHSGRIVAKGNISAEGKINVSNLANGNYILNIELKNGEKITDKLMIKK